MVERAYPTLHYILGWVRWAVYKMGFRPRLGTVLHSPSLHLRCYFKDADVAGAFAKGLKQGEARGLSEITPHKHKLSYIGLSLEDTDGVRLREMNERLEFTCLEDDCVFGHTYFGQVIHYSVRLPRWRYRELMLTQRPVNQNWPG